MECPVLYCLSAVIIILLCEFQMVQSITEADFYVLGSGELKKLGFGDDETAQITLPSFSFFGMEYTDINVSNEILS